MNKNKEDDRWAYRMRDKPLWQLFLHQRSIGAASTGSWPGGSSREPELTL